MVLLLPLPDGLDELGSAKVVTGLALSSPQHVLDDTLGRNTGVIATWQPESSLAVHSVPSNHQILQRIAQGVTHVQSTSDVGGRVDDNETTLILDGAVGLELGLEEAFLLPPAIPSRLDGNGVVGLEMGVVERSNSLLLSLGGVLDVFGERFLLGLLFLGRLRGGRGSLYLLGLELGLLLGLLSLLFYYIIVLDGSAVEEELAASCRTVRTLLRSLHFGTAGGGCSAGIRTRGMSVGSGAGNVLFLIGGDRGGGAGGILEALSGTDLKRQLISD